MTRKTKKNRDKSTVSLIQMVQAGSLQKVLKTIPKLDKDALLEKDKKKKVFLDYADGTFKKQLLESLESNCRQKDYSQKKQLVLESASKNSELAEFDEEGILVEECILAFLLKNGPESFKTLAQINLALNAKVPGCPNRLRFYDYYHAHHHSKFWQYLIDNVEQLDEFGINRVDLLSEAVSAKASLTDIDVLLSGGVCIESAGLSLSKFKAYVNSFPNDHLKTKILTTVNLFENMKFRKQIAKLIQKPHYSKVFNKNGNTIIHELAEHGYEKECIALLSKKRSEKPLYNNHQDSIWHTAVKNNLGKLLSFLLEKQKRNIDSLNQKSLSAWALAVILGNKEIAKTLENNEANTSLFINEQGQTILHYAIASDDDELVNRCYDCSVRIDTPDINGYTPLFYAGLKNDIQLYEFLKKFRGAKNLEQIDFFNAVARSDVQGLKALLARGVDPNIKNNLRRTALDVALIYQHNEIADILRQAGGESNLTQSEIVKIRHEVSKKSKTIDTKYNLILESSENGPVLTITELDTLGKKLNSKLFSPWSKEKDVNECGRWKVITNNGLCYVLLTNSTNPSQPEVACLISSNGDVNLSFANLPKSQLTITTYGNFTSESLSLINHLSVNARNIITSKQCKLFNGTRLKFEADNIELNGAVSFKEAEIIAHENYKQLGDVTTENLNIKSSTTYLQGQIVASNQYSFQVDGSFTHRGQLIAGKQGAIKAHSVQLERNCVVVTQQGALNIHGSARVNNSGAIVANQINLDSNIIITNNIGAMIKGLQCILHAPQVNQAGFLLSGQKSTLSAVDWTLNSLHAGVNVLELVSIIPAPSAVVARGYLLVAKTLYRGVDLLRKSANGESIQTSELIALILDNIVPSIGMLTSSQERATLLVNILYQFYGAYNSEDKFIYKSLEFIEALTRALGTFSGGLLTEENMQWLQSAATIINGSRHALKLADISVSAYQAWSNDDQKELEKAQANLQSITEVVFREALYKLEPYQLLGFNLGVKPLDVVHFILNQGLDSDLYLQSIVYGVLHAAQRSGVLDAELQNDLQVGARFLFRMKHWQELYKDYQDEKLTTHAIVNEALNSLMVILSSDRVRNVLKEPSEPVISEAMNTVPEEVVSQIHEEIAATETEGASVVVSSNPIEEVIEDIPQNLTNEELEKLHVESLEKIKQDIPEHPKQVLTLDVEAIAENNLAALPTTPHQEEIGITLLKSLIEVQKAVNGEYAAHGYLGMFVTALHNEGIMEVTGDIGINANIHATNNSVIKATSTVSISGQDVSSRKQDGTVLSQKVAESINTHFTNFEAGTIDAGEAIYLTCVGLVENFGEIKSLGKINTTANRIIRNHNSGKIIAKRDVKLLCDLLAKNEGIIIGENVHFEGTRDKALNEGTIIGVEKIRLISEKLAASSKGAKLVSKRVDFESAEVRKEGAVQAEIVRTQGFDAPTPDTVRWQKDEDDNVGVAVIKANETPQIDKDALDKVQIADVTLKELPSQAQESIFDISPNFSNTLQLHLPESDTLIPIWQLPKMQSSATFILDAPGARLSSAGSQNTYDSSLYFIGNRFDFSADSTTFSRLALFDVKEIEGIGPYSLLTLNEGGFFQADTMSNQGHIRSDDILYWNVDSLQNDAQLVHSTEYFTYSKRNPIAQACPTTKVIENSGTIDALGHRGYVGNFRQIGGRFRSGNEGNWMYFANGVQEAILTQHGENPTGVLHDAGQNWYLKPEWHNAEISSTGQNVFIGSGSMRHSGLDFWGDELAFLYAQSGVEKETKLQRYEIDQILSLTRHGRVNGIAHERETGYVATVDHISSNKGDVIIAAPEGSIHLENVVLSSAGNISLIAKDEVSISGITVDKHHSYAYKNRTLLSSKTVSSSTEEKLVYSSFIFTGGELIVRCHDFTLNAVQGAIGGADIVAHTTTLSGQNQTSQNTTITREVSIGVPGQDLVSVLRGHNAQAIFSSLMNSCGWDQKELENLLNVKNAAELPKPLLNTARNAWNLTAFVAYACGEFGGTPSDFVGIFTDQMGLTFVDGDNERHFNPKVTLNSSKMTEETQTSQTISTNLFVGGTFRLYGNELHLLDGAMVDAEHLRIFLIEGIKATKGVNTYSYKSTTNTHGVGLNLLNPEDISASMGRSTQSEYVTETTLSELHARSTAQVHGGRRIEGELIIEGEKGGVVTAEEMNFSTPQNTRVLRSRSRSANASTAPAFGFHYQSHSVDEALTADKAGVILPGGEVSANAIHLGNGSKIQTGQLSRVDDQEGLPLVSGTAGNDHSSERQRSLSFNLSAQGGPSGDVAASHKSTETIHRPTIIADNVGAEALPGINTQANKESEIISEKSDGFAVAGFIPNKDKLHADVEAMKEAYDKGLHWLFGSKDRTKTPTEPVQLTSSALLPNSDDSGYLAVTEPKIVTQNEALPFEQIYQETLIDYSSISDTLYPIYQFGEEGTWFHSFNSRSVLMNTILFNRDMNQDSLLPIYQVPKRDECPLLEIDSEGRKNINICKSFKPIVSHLHRPFSLPSAVPAYDEDPFWNYTFAFCRGVEKARDMTVDALLHPIDSAINAGTLVWDGYNALGDLAFDFSTGGARERNAQRGSLYNGMIEEFERADSIHRTEVLTEISASMLFGGAFGGIPRGIFSLGMQSSGLAIATPYGFAYQSFLPRYFMMRNEIRDGRTIYRAGTTPKPTENIRGSKGIEGQFWATEPPFKTTYARDFGIPEENVINIDFAIGGELRTGSSFITRPAPGVGRNPGGAVELVTIPHGVQLSNPSVIFSRFQRIGDRSLFSQIADKSVQSLASEQSLVALVNQNEATNERQRSKVK
jgi:ankyrin repeat protein